MKKNVNVWQRLLALVLACVLVVGNLPVYAAAEGTEDPLESFSAKLICTTKADKKETTIPGDMIVDENGAPVLDAEGNETFEPDTVETTYENLQHTYKVEGAPDGAAVVEGNPATVTVGNKVLVLSIEAPTAVEQEETVNSVEGTWSCTIGSWTDMTAGSTVYAPEVSLGSEDGKFESKFTSDVACKITDQNDATVENGATATVSMGTLTAAYKVGDDVIATRTANVLAAPVVVESVSPDTGWYAALPQEVTVVATSDAPSADDVQSVAGVDAKWEKNEEGKYVLKFQPVSAVNYSIGGNTYIWAEDAVTPAIHLTSAYVNDTGNTFVAYEYTVGPSGATISIEGETDTVHSSGTGSMTLTGTKYNVYAKIENNLNTPVSAEDTKPVIQKPYITYSGYISDDGTTMYVADNTVLKFSIKNGESATWLAPEAGEGESININAATYAGQNLVVEARDNMGRNTSVTTSKITLDVEKPVITLVTPADETAPYTEITHFPAERTYSISVSDNAGLDTFSGKVTIDGVESPISFEGNSASIKVANGQTLTKIVVDATDKAGNAAEQLVYNTNVHVDTIKPVVSGSLSVVYADGTAGTISNLYKVGSKIFLILNEGATNQGDKDDAVTVTVTYNLIEDNDNGQNGWNDGVITKTVVVPENECKTLDLSVAAKDLAGNVATNSVELYSDLIAMDPTDGKYAMTLTIDRRPPENADNALETAPEVTLGVDGNSTTIDGIRYFNGNFNFNMEIKDADSGLAEEDGEDPIRSANIVVETTGDGFTYPTQTVKPDAAGKASIKIDVGAGKEFDNGLLTLKIYDNVGNYYFYNEAFAIDSQAPRVTVEQPEAHKSSATNFYRSAITLNFAMDDQIMTDATTATISYKINGEDKSLVLTGKDPAGSITVNKGERLTDLKIVATDAAGNTTTSFSGYTFQRPIEVDSTPAKVTITRSNTTPAATEAGVDYYDAEVNITVSVSDKTIDNTNGKATLYYTIDNGAEQTKEIALTDNAGSITFPVEGDKALTGLRVYVEDNAGNTTSVFENGVPGTAAADGSLTYTGNKVAVDVTTPVIKIERVLTNAKHYQTVNGKSYFKEVADGDVKVTYTATITDKFLNQAKSAATMNTTNGTYTAGAATLADEDTLVVTFDVTDTTILSDIVLTAEDMTGKGAAAVEVVAEAPNDILFTESGSTVKTFTYASPDVIVDSIAPVATMVLTGEVSSLVKDGETYYIRLNQAAELESGGLFTTDEKEIGLTVKVTDTNLSLTQADGQTETSFISSKVNAWTLNGTEATYTDTLKAKLHHTDDISVDVAAYDMAGHPIELTIINLGSATDGAIHEVNYTGVVKANFVLDRRSPSSKDEEAPEITLDDNGATKVMTATNLELYGVPFNYSLNVKDSYEEEKYAGLKTVNWTLDGAGVVTNVSKNNSLGDHRVEFADTIPVGGSGETDDAVINITATDMVDNKITYVKKFAYDDLAPRVKIEFTGKSVRQNKYFNQDRVATVTVEDLHLPDVSKMNEYVKITTGGTAGNWEITGNVATIKYTFNTDGEYTFKMDYAKDLYGNTSVDTDVTYVGEHCQDFVVDKTDPVIKVNYSPANPSGRDKQGVSYYDKNMTATVTITERNFQAADVNAAFNRGGLALRGWSTGEDHVSSVTFGEGNEYAFTIDFTDLAGNKATSYKSHTFSVDTHAPTIEISRGDLSNDGLNIVQDDLTLGFTINDEQKNLSDYKVTVTKLDNEFKKVEISGSDFYTITEQDERTTVVVNFKSIAQEKLNDGLYTVEITAKDYAGNDVNLTPDLVFSLNRFGSTFMTDDEYTLDFLALGNDGNVYHREVKDKLVIHEINPNKVWNDSSKKEEGSVLTVIVNGTSTKLEEGKDYKMDVSEQGTEKSRWYVYTYEIEPDAFADGGNFVDGRYSILISGEDEAGNKNTNQSNVSGKLQKDVEGEYNGKVEFVLDTTAPIITTTGIESGKNYDAEAQKLEIFLSDSTPSAITVYLNGNQVPLSEALVGLAETAEWLVYDEATGSYILNVPELNTLFSGQEIRIAVVDAAGNEAELSINDFSVSTNVFVRLLNSTWFIVSIIVLAILIVLFILLNVKKRRAMAA